VQDCDSCAQLQAERLAIACRGYRPTEGDPGFDPALAQQVQQMRTQRCVSPPADFIFRNTVFQLVANRTWSNDFSRAKRGLQHGGVKAKELRTVGGRSFGKYDDPDSILQAFGDAKVGARTVAVLLALYKDRPCLFGETSDDRQISDLCLRDEYAGERGAERQNVEITEVITDDQSVPRNVALH